MLQVQESFLRITLFWLIWEVLVPNLFFFNILICQKIKLNRCRERILVVLGILCPVVLCSSTFTSWSYVICWYIWNSIQERIFGYEDGCSVKLDAKPFALYIQLQMNKWILAICYHKNEGTWLDQYDRRERQILSVAAFHDGTACCHHPLLSHAKTSNISIVMLQYNINKKKEIVFLFTTL